MLKQYERNAKGYIKYPKVELKYIWACPVCRTKYADSGTKRIGYFHCKKCARGFRSFDTISPDQNDLFANN